MPSLVVDVEKYTFSDYLKKYIYIHSGGGGGRGWQGPSPCKKMLLPCKSCKYLIKIIEIFSWLPVFKILFLILKH